MLKAVKHMNDKVDISIERSVYKMLLAFKPIAEKVLGASLEDEEYYSLVVSVGLVRMLKDVLMGTEYEPKGELEVLLWKGFVNMFTREPEAVCDFIDKNFDLIKSIKKVGELWRGSALYL